MNIKVMTTAITTLIAAASVAKSDESASESAAQVYNLKIAVKTMAEFADIDFEVVSGSWKLKYDAGASKKLKEKVSIVDAVKLPSNVKLRVSQKILETL